MVISAREMRVAAAVRRTAPLELMTTESAGRAGSGVDVKARSWRMA